MSPGLGKHDDIGHSTFVALTRVAVSSRLYDVFNVVPHLLVSSSKKVERDSNPDQTEPLIWDNLPDTSPSSQSQYAKYDPAKLYGRSNERLRDSSRCK